MENYFTMLLKLVHWFSKMWCCSVSKSCLTLCDPMDCSTAGFPVLHHLSEFAQTRFHWVDGAIQPSHPLSSPFPPAFSLSQHQGFFLMSGLFTLDGQNIGASASVLPVNIQKWFPLQLTGFDLLAVPRDSEESSPTLQFKIIGSSVFFRLSLLYGPTLMSWLLKKQQFWLDGPLLAK